MGRLTILFFFVCLLNFSCSDKQAIPTIILESDKEIGWKKMDCTIRYNGIEKQWKSEAEVKRRGGASSLFKKMSFALELEKKKKFEGLKKDDDWILNANYIDKTFMRHILSYELFREMGRENEAAYSQFVNLTVNNADQGLYVLMEEVNAKKLGINKEDPLGMLFKDPPIFFKDNPYAAFDSVNLLQQKYPKVAYRDNSPYLQSFIDFLFESDDPTFESQIDTWVDIDNIIDWHLLLLFSNNSDGIMKNFYWYKKDEKTPFRVAPWDYDHSFGRDGDNGLNMIKPLNCERSILLKRLLETNAKDYKARLKREWDRLVARDILTKDFVQRFVQKRKVQISDAVARNAKIWPTSANYYKDQNNFEAELNLMMDYLEQRIPQIEAYLSKLK